MARLNSGDNVFFLNQEIERLRYQLSQYKTLLGVAPFDKIALKGDKGDVGPRGLRGEQGDPGPKGDKGEQGIQGIQGIQGLRGYKGDTGKYGETKFVINDNMELEQHTLIGDPLNFAIVNDELVLTEDGETVILGKTGAVPTYIDITATRNEEDYNSIRDLVKSITDASYYKRYRIHIPAGRWFECDLNGKKYTELIGEGIGKTIIYNDTTSSNLTPSDYSFSQSAEQELNSISRMTTHVIMATDDFIATDISFTVNSAKYPVHLDNPGYSEVKFTRCYFEITVGACFGIGINSGQRIEFNQCQFMDYGTDGTDGTGSSGYIHNWLNGTEKAIVTFNECHWLSNGGYAYIEDLGGYHDTIINFNSCTSSFSNPDIYYNVLLGFWKKEDGTNETNASLIPYTIKVNCQNTKVPVIKLSSPNKRENYRSYINCNWGDVSENTLIVSGSKTPAENAKELSSVYAIAKLMRPNGANLSSTNRVKILIKPGQYVFGSAIQAAADPIFTIDTQYIDLLSYTGEADVCIDGFYVKANDVKIRGLKSYLLDINDDRWMLLLNSNLDKLVMENCHSSNYGFVTKTRIITDIVNGTFIKCTARMYSFGFKSTASGTFTDCTSKDQSFGALGFASGTFIRCKSANVLCFGSYYGGTASGYFEDCKGGDYSFGGMNGSFTGKAVRCIAGEDSFGKNGDTGTLINCELLNTVNTYKTGLKIYNSINGTGIMINQ